MRRYAFLGRFFGVFIILIIWLGGWLGPELPRALAAPVPPPGPDRFAVVIVDYTSYQWWLVGWGDNQVACEIYVDHEGLPDGDEIYTACGETLFKLWSNTKPCEEIGQGGDPSHCKGYYLFLAGSGSAQRKVGVALPPPVVWVSLSRCVAQASTNVCSQSPVLVLTGDEPLPNESILSIQGTMNGEAFSCGPLCELSLEATDTEGIELVFWAYSSYGDSSLPFQASLRVIPVEDGTPDSTWYVDVLSTQWVGAPIAGCAQSWSAFPPVGGPPVWLSTPDDPAELASNIPFEYLAGNLIAQGVVDVRDCPEDGLLPSGAASPCGLEQAQSAVDEWQNRFDQQIHAIAQETGVPAQLLKNLFSRESQFWPGVFTNTPEVGLGQLTENGADTALLWNPTFYEQFCPLVLDNTVCRDRYPHLEPENQAILRGALVRSVDAFCAGCPLGLDLRLADFSVSVFAETLLANCEQAGRIVRNVSNKSPGQASNYVDMWRFTLVNYNAGPGCLSLAMQAAVKAHEPLDWEHISARLTPACQGAIDYVEDICR